ncbi:MAG: LD-carboxypeptidase [Holosporales bacterium]|nr:LD-carboxypeptidase [Holosporales bacterium]
MKKGFLFIIFVLIKLTCNATEIILTDLQIRAICPSSGIDHKIAALIAAILGCKFEYSTGTSDDQVYSDPNAKADQLVEAVNSDEPILWFIRGGYGIDAILGVLCKKSLPNASKKIIIGYSDGTAFLIYMSQKYGCTAINGPFLKDLALRDKSPESSRLLLNFLRKKSSTLAIRDLVPLNQAARNSTRLCGKTTGGNLTCIISTIGTPWQIQTAGKILFLEDVNVEGYRFHRLLVHMLNAGLIKDVVAIIFGDCGKKVDPVIIHFATGNNIPVFKSCLFGHGKNNNPWGYGFNGVISKQKGRYEIRMCNPNC